MRDSSQIFQAGGQNVDFSKNVEAAAIINKWVSQKFTDTLFEDVLKKLLYSNIYILLQGI